MSPWLVFIRSFVSLQLHKLPIGNHGQTSHSNSIECPRSLQQERDCEAQASERDEESPLASMWKGDIINTPQAKSEESSSEVELLENPRARKRLWALEDARHQPKEHICFPRRNIKLIPWMMCG